MVVLFLGAMMGLVFSANLILMYVFWETTAITSRRLIGVFGGIATFGFIGVFPGPMLLTVGYSLVQDIIGQSRQNRSVKPA
jgi:NADH:ubiquinone oxidoreductase subunit 5 (subunit L)/multisubunit Na+/H+ antiporter MnhA subunit